MDTKVSQDNHLFAGGLLTNASQNRSLAMVKAVEELQHVKYITEQACSPVPIQHG
jgi:hypothetical protein